MLFPTRNRDLALSLWPTLLVVLLGACVSPPPRAPETARIATIPAGARCVTSDGTTYVTPAAIPCPRGGVLRLVVALEGHEPRRIQLHTRPPSPHIKTFFLGEFFQGLTEEPWEHVDALSGEAVFQLEPLTDR